VEGAESPDRLTCRLVAFRDLSDIARDLSISAQVMNELSVRGAEEPLANGAKPGSGGRPRLLGALIFSKERLKIRAPEFGAAIDDDNLREPVVTHDAISHNHHAGSVTRLIEGQIKRKTPPGKGISEDRHPWTAKWATSLSANNLYVQLRVIDMANLKRTISVPRCCQFQLVIESRLDICSAPALSF
jgi:hypothetical protein